MWRSSASSTSSSSAAAGLLLASWIGRLVVALYPSDVPLHLGVDLREIGYAFLLAALTGLAVGLVPGLQASRPSLVPALKDDGRATGFSRQRRGGRERTPLRGGP